MPFATRTQSVITSTNATSQALVNKLVGSVQTGIDAEVAKGSQANAQVISAYGAVLTGAATLQKSLPTNQGLSFSLSREEVLVLIAYAIGGLALLFVIPIFTPWAGWKSSDLASLFLDWSGVFAILLGASALPQLTGKGGSSPSGSGAGAGVGQ
jgi:hypothetical protein